MLELLGGTPVLAAALLALLLAYLGHKFLYKPFTYFDGFGMPGPQPVPVLGNIGMLWRFNGSFDGFFRHLLKEYGKVSRLFFGTKGGLVIADPDAIKEVTVKQFDCFTERQSGSSLKIKVNGKYWRTIDTEKADAWRRRRRVLTPAFSAHKLKLTAPLVKESVDRLVEVCRENADKGQTVDALVVFRNLTMEVILATAFGCQIDIQKSGKGDQNLVYQAAKAFIEEFNTESSLLIPLSTLADVYPPVALALSTLLKVFNMNQSQDSLVEHAKAVVTKRRAEIEKGEVPRKDLLQLMMDASQGEGDGKQTIDEAEMVLDVLFMLVAGYDTTSNTLAYVAYRLAIHPEVQDRLAEQVLQYFQDNPDKTALDAANEVEYVEMVISETQRLHPPVIFLDRMCTKPCTVAGVPFKEGMFAVIPIESVHYDPDFWPEPNTFDPDRFSAEEKKNRHPCAYLPFGLGPRNCVGMRFALIEAKVALIEIIRNFKIMKTPETKVPLATTGLFLKNPAPGAASVRFELRE